MSGFIQLHRKITSWEWYDDHNATRLFIHCLLIANHKDNKWRGIVVEKGSFITSLGNLSLSVGMSLQQVRTSLNKLKSTNDIIVKSTNKNTLVTVVNYKDYQGADAVNNKQTTNKQHSSNKQITTNNNDNNINNDNKVITHNPFDADFEIVWQEYKPYEMGTKGNKKTSLKSYITARKKIDHETIRNGVTRYIQHCHATQCKTKHFSTWLNQEGWADEYSTPQNKKSSYLDSLANASRTVQADMEADFDEW